MSDNKTLEAIIKLRDEISKPLKDVQNALDNTKKATEPVSKELSKLQKIINFILTKWHVNRTNDENKIYDYLISY